MSIFLKSLFSRKWHSQMIAAFDDYLFSTSQSTSTLELVPQVEARTAAPVSAKVEEFVQEADHAAKQVDLNDEDVKIAAELVCNIRKSFNPPSSVVPGKKRKSVDFDAVPQGETSDQNDSVAMRIKKRARRSCVGSSLVRKADHSSVEPIFASSKVSKKSLVKKTTPVPTRCMRSAGKQNPLETPVGDDNKRRPHKKDDKGLHKGKSSPEIAMGAVEQPSQVISKAFTEADRQEAEEKEEEEVVVIGSLAALEDACTPAPRKSTRHLARGFPSPPSDDDFPSRSRSLKRKINDGYASDEAVVDESVFKRPRVPVNRSLNSKKQKKRRSSSSVSEATSSSSVTVASTASSVSSLASTGYDSPPPRPCDTSAGTKAMQDYFLERAIAMMVEDRGEDVQITSQEIAYDSNFLEDFNIKVFSSS